MTFSLKKNGESLWQRFENEHGLYVKLLKTGNIYRLMLEKLPKGTLFMLRAYEEIVDFIAEGTSPGKVVAFRPSETTKARVEELIYREKTTGLSPDETAELNHYLQLEHLMRLAKVRALGYIKNES